MKLKYQQHLQLVEQKLSKSMSPFRQAIQNKMSSMPYRKATMKLVYLVNVSRPDIAYATNIVSWFHTAMVENTAQQ